MSHHLTYLRRNKLTDPQTLHQFLQLQQRREMIGVGFFRSHWLLGREARTSGICCSFPMVWNIFVCALNSVLFLYLERWALGVSEASER
jgi:hypothetical protein